MELTQPFSNRISGFLAAFSALPAPGDMPAELVVISTGAIPGKWAYKHVFTPGDTQYFIFRKSEITDLNAATWQCADHELEALVKHHINHNKQP